MIKIYTDGACSPNPGKGGWGCYIVHPDKTTIELNGGREDTTNNQMELTAAIRALEYFENKSKLEIITDSQYVRKGVTQWINMWSRNGWRTASKKPVKNADLWQELHHHSRRHTVKWTWVRGHNGNPGNEKADELAGLYVYGDKPKSEEKSLSRRIADLEEYVADLHERIEKLETMLVV